MTKAYQLQDRASDREKFFIAASYDFRVTGNLEKGEQSCVAWAQAYPCDYDPPGILGGVVYPAFGKYEKAVEESAKQLSLIRTLPLDTAIWRSIRLPRSPGAGGESPSTGFSTKPGSHDAGLPYDIAFLKGDQVGMEREATQEQATSESEAQSWYYQAFAMAYSGRLQQARTMTARATDMAQQAINRKKRPFGEPEQPCWRHSSHILLPPGRRLKQLWSFPRSR